jgi:iron(III) transport system ATP-binding protein
MAELLLSDVSFHHGDKQVLDNINFTVKPGELLCLVGPSGSGKSTLLRLIAGLTKIQSGSIKIGDMLLADPKKHMPTQERKTGLVFQHPSLFPHLTVYQNIAFGIRNLTKEQQQEKVNKLLSMINLEAFADRYPHTLSGGQQQRVALARALAPEPLIMLLDEPFANLDYRLRRDIAEDVIGVLKEAKMPIIMVTHDPEEALMIADRMVLLSKDGAIKQMGEPDILHNKPVDVESAAFFGPINRINAYIEDDLIVSSLGALPAKSYLNKYEEGQKVLIVTRPEGLRINEEANSCVNAVVKKTRHTGTGWLINADVEKKFSVRFHHIYGECPNIGEHVCINLQPPHVFVFKS